jgi:hypothetical protein
LGENFANLVKIGKEDAKLLKRIFSHFAKKLRKEKSDSKLLEMLICIYVGSIYAS